ncbi:MAG: recombinase family protein [Candidatus Paceibacterota bacterium]
MKAIILARVSTEEQREAGNSLPAQIARMERYCEQQNFEIVETFSFDESAYKTKRDEFDKILEYLQTNKEKIAVCFDKVDRLSRNVFDKRVSLLYEKAVNDEIELHFVSDGQVINSNMSAVAKFQFGMSLGLAKYYSDAISDNVKRAFEKMRAEGKWTGRVRIGYKNITDENGNRDIALDEERSSLVHKIFELYATGNHSLASITNEMSRFGLKSLNGNKLWKSNVDLILNDTFYYGMAYSKKYNYYYPHKYEKLISKELFFKCKEVRLSRARKPSKVDSNNFIFKGLLTCKKCGCSVTPEIKTKKSGKQYIYYSCTNSKGICKREYIPESTLLEPIIDVLERFEGITKDTQDYLLKELRKNNEAEVEFHKKQLKRINIEYQTIQTKISKLTDLLLDDSITKESYEDKLQELKHKQLKLGIEIDLHTKADKDYLLTLSKVLMLATRVKIIFESSEIHEKRALLNYLIQNPTVNRKKLHFTIASPFNLVLELSGNPTWLRGQDSNLRQSPYM